MLSSLLVGYMFCGGAGAGACVLLSIAGLLVPRNRFAVNYDTASPRRAADAVFIPEVYRRLFFPAFVVAFGMLSFGSLMLILDLGLSNRAVLLFSHPTLTYITVGSFSLITLLGIAFLQLMVWGQLIHFPWRYVVIRALLWAALALGIVVVAYTGMFLASLDTVPFWHNPWVPALFIASGFSCGWAIVLLCASLSGAIESFRSLILRFNCIDVVLLVFEVFALVGLFAAASASPYAIASQGAEALLDGEFAVLFLGGTVCGGILLPLTIEMAVLVACKPCIEALSLVALSILGGGFFLRYCIVMAGSHPDVWTAIA